MSPALPFLFFLLLGNRVLADDRELSVVSWNVNGVRKLSYLPSVVQFIQGHDVILLQETFAYDDKDLFELQGFLSHHVRALPGTRRNLWGLSTLFRTRSFADGFLEKIDSSLEWVLVSRWRQPGFPGLLVVNIYAPLHSRFDFLLSYIKLLICFLFQFFQ
jgi:exonuclease III